MPELAVLGVFIPTFFVVSISPGMCMTLAMTLGIRYGVRRTMWMMLGELVGVGLVAGAAVIGVAAIMVNLPALFSLLKFGGAAYLIYIGVNIIRSSAKIELQQDIAISSRSQLILQGFLTAIANPKGWVFMVSFLPPFIDVERPMALQLVGLIAVIIVIEFSSLMIYATGGKSLKALLANGNHLTQLNKLSGALMIGVGIWLALS